MCVCARGVSAYVCVYLWFVCVICLFMCFSVHVCVCGVRMCVWWRVYADCVCVCVVCVCVPVCAVCTQLCSPCRTCVGLCTQHHGADTEQFQGCKDPPSALLKTPPINNSLTNLPPSPPTPDLFSNLWQPLICSSFLKYSHFQMSHKGSRQFPFLSDRCPEVYLLGESPSHITRFLENCCPFSQSDSST